MGERGCLVKQWYNDIEECLHMLENNRYEEALTLFDDKEIRFGELWEHGGNHFEKMSFNTLRFIYANGILPKTINEWRAEMNLLGRHNDDRLLCSFMDVYWNHDEVVDIIDWILDTYEYNSKMILHNLSSVSNRTLLNVQTLKSMYSHTLFTSPELIGFHRIVLNASREKARIATADELEKIGAIMRWFRETISLHNNPQSHMQVKGATDR